MSVDRTRLHIAVQRSGRLSDASKELLREAGLRLEAGKNSLTARSSNFPADLMFVRDDDIPTFVSDGACEFGIVGENVLEEFALGQAQPRFERIADLADKVLLQRIFLIEPLIHHDRWRAIVGRVGGQGKEFLGGHARRSRRSISKSNRGR